MRQYQDRARSSEDWENEGGSLCPPRGPISIQPSRSMTGSPIIFDPAVMGPTASDFVSVRSEQSPRYVGVLMPIAALALLIWWMI